MSASLTFEQARIEMLNVFKTAWDAGPVSPVPSVVYDDNQDFSPTAGSPWARVTVKFNDAHQVGPGPLGVNAALFRRHGIIFVDIFVVQGTGMVTLGALAKVVQDAFEGQQSASGIWFRNTRYRPIGIDQAWFHGQALTEFIFDQIR